MFKHDKGNDLGISIYKFYGFGIERSNVRLRLGLTAIRRGFDNDVHWNSSPADSRGTECRSLICLLSDVCT